MGERAEGQVTPRERWLVLLSGRKADRIPTDYQATPEVTARLLKDLRCATEDILWRRLRIDKRRILEPPWKLAHHPDDPLADMWGVRFQTVHYGTGAHDAGAYEEAVFHPLDGAQTSADVDRFRWPEPEDFDYAAVTREVEASDGYYPIHAGCYEPFLIYGSLRGLERSFEDLALRPAIAEAILGKIFEFSYEYHRRLFEAGKGRIDLTWVAEDLGSQTGPLISLTAYRRFLLPNQIRMADLARRYGVHVMYHTDGAARVFLPDLIERVGVEVLNPIQWRCPGMEREALVRDFGKHVVFHGAIDNQRTLAFGSAMDVRAEVRDSVRIFADARWICAPCHNIQPVSPTESIVAMYEAIREMGAFEEAGHAAGPVAGSEGS